MSAGKPARHTMLLLLALLLISYGVGTVDCSTVPDNSTDMLSLLDFKQALTNDPRQALSSWNSSIPHCKWEGVNCSLTHPGRVTVLNLGELSLSGPISPSLGNLTFLKILNLSTNSFTGELPQSFSNLKSLVVLNISHNKLSGFIPISLAAMRFLEQLDLSYNQMQGEIPRIGIFDYATPVSLNGNWGLCGGAVNLHMPTCPTISSRKGRKYYLVRALIPLFGFTSLVLLIYFVLLERKTPRTLFLLLLSFGKHFPRVPYTDSQIRDVTVERFLQQIAGEKPIRFTPQQLSGFTNNYSARLGAGGFGVVYRGFLPNGLAVAVKRLHAGHGDRSSQEQFMAEVGTIGRTHHINLVRLFGFCFDADVRALVYEYMEHGALDSHLFDPQRAAGIAFPTLRDIAVGIARGLRYLHEECQQKIVHYDIKPGNVLLDGDLIPKVADFGLAKLLNRADTHQNVSGMRGTPGYAAPEMWMQAGASEKCDVYSFGILLFEIVGRRRNFDEAAPESRGWFPKLAWTKYERGELMDVVERSEANSVGEQDKETAKRMCEVAFWCVQQLPEARPTMGTVVKMLEGGMDIPPPPNPFQHLMSLPVVPWTSNGRASTSVGNGSENGDSIVSIHS